MSHRVYIIDAATGIPAAGFFKARLVKNGPYVPVLVKTREQRDEDENLVADVEYYVEIGGREVRDWYDRFRVGLIGQSIDEAEYRHTLEALAWDKANIGIEERKAVDIRAIPPVLPTGGKK